MLKTLREILFFHYLLQLVITSFQEESNEFWLKHKPDWSIRNYKKRLH